MFFFFARRKRSALLADSATGVHIDARPANAQLRPLC